MKIPEEFDILWTPGGAHGQFSAIPLNMKHLLDNAYSFYAVNGTWSNRAYSESKKFIKTRNLFHKYYGKQEALNYINTPTLDKSMISTLPYNSYIYLCSNETVNGMEFDDSRNPYPSRDIMQSRKLVVDMSSDFLMKKISWDKMDVVFSSSSKNMGVAGANIVVVRKELLEDIRKNTSKLSKSSRIPSILDWNLYSNTKSSTIHQLFSIIQSI